MSAQDTPIEAFRKMARGLNRMIKAEERMNADPDGYFDPDFDLAATEAMQGWHALMAHNRAFGEMIEALCRDPASLRFLGAEAGAAVEAARIEMLSPKAAERAERAAVEAARQESGLHVTCSACGAPQAPNWGRTVTCACGHRTEVSQVHPKDGGL